MDDFEKVKREALKAVEVSPVKSAVSFPLKDQSGLRKRMSTAKIIVAAFIAIALAILLYNSTSKPPMPQPSASTYIAQGNLPHFAVASIYRRSTLSILVPPETSSEQLTALINEFKNARIHKAFSRYFPATTSGGALGDYAVVWVFVFKDRQWATDDKMHRFINASPKRPEDQFFEQEFASNIVAEYYFGITAEEYGTLGYDDGKVRSSNYRQLFRTKMVTDKQF